MALAVAPGSAALAERFGSGTSGGVGRGRFSRLLAKRRLDGSGSTEVACRED